MQLVIRRWPAILVLAAASLAFAAEPERAFRLQFETPAVLAYETGEGLAVEVEGFDTHGRRAGAPDVPWRTLLVAIPEGAEPTLTVERGGDSLLIALGAPRPIPSLRSVPLTEDPLGPTSVEQVYRVDGDAFAAGSRFPERAAWLGRRGVLRNQAYVELHLAPVRFDADRGGIVSDEILDVTVDFGAPLLRTAQAPADPRFEDVYRSSFVNYGQGRSFRLSPAALQPARVPNVPNGAETPVRRIVVREAGLIRLDHTFISTEAPELLAHDPTTWKLTGRGEQIPLQIFQSGGDPALLEAGEWIQFYGQALDDEPEQVLNTDTGGLEDIYEIRDYSDENVYFLSVAGSAQPAMAERAAAPGVLTPPADFPSTARAEVNDVFFPLAGAGIDYWLPLLSESAPSRQEIVPLPQLASGTEPAQFRVAFRGVSSCDGFAPDHASRVTLRNSSLQTMILPAGNPDNVGNENIGTFDGLSEFIHDFDWTHSGGEPLLTDPMRVILLVDDLPGSCPTGGGISNDVLLDWIEIDYRRSFVATGDALLFDFPNGDEDFTVTGLTSGPGAVEVYELTGELGSSGIADAVRLTGVAVAPDGGGGFQASFHMADDPGLTGQLRRFLVVGTGAIQTPAPADFQADRVSLLAQDTTQADMIVVAHPDLLDSVCSEGGNPCSYDVDCTASDSDRCELDPTSTLAELLAHRASQGISSRVARIGDVRDDFNDGLDGPLGIRNLVAWTLGGGWSGDPPSYLLLLGDATYDYKGGLAVGNYVPTQIMLKNSEILAFYASDNVLGDAVGGDQLPDVAVGRVSARTLAEAETTLQKILDYEQMPESGNWRSNLVFASDRANDFGEFEALEFERINSLGVDAISGTAYTSQTLRYWSDYCVPQTWTCTIGGNVCVDDDDCSGGGGVCLPDCDTAAMQTAIQNAVNGVTGPGAALLQFMGHGNFDVWSTDVLFCARESACGQDDTLSLTNGGKLPWVIVHNCLSGGFHSLPEKSMGEQWLKYGGGGASAVFAPSGLGFRFLGEGVSEVIWEDLFGQTKARQLAVPVMNSLVRLCSQDSIEGCQFYTLLGDPAMQLALPDVDPPEDPLAVGGNGVVQLSWTASATPGATYDIYRTKQLLPPFTLPYEKINGAPVATPSYDDTDVVNTESYYYYVVAVDPDGFESRWSNFNSDCDVEGDDCLVAVPINSLPPTVPSGVVVTDAESGGRLDVAWAGGSEADLDFFTVHFGTTPGLGQTAISFTNEIALTGLTDGATYYVAVAATNTSGITSGLSAPLVTGVPTLLLGVRAPGFVGDLMIGRSGDDAQLTWGDVLLDIYGAPDAAASYEVYRGASVTFVPGVPTRIATPAVSEYLDEDAIDPGTGSEYYLVRAVDAQGNFSGLGNDLPIGTTGLTVGHSQSSPGQITLDWPDVSTDVAGNPIDVVAYEVYATDGPFSRADIQSGAIGAPVWSGASSTVDLPKPAVSRHYSVLAVDSRGNRSPF